MRRSEKFTRRDELILLLEQNPGWHTSAWLRGRMCINPEQLSKLLQGLLKEGLVEYRERERKVYSYAGKTAPLPGRFKNPRDWKLKIDDEQV